MKNCWIIGASCGIGLELAKKYYSQGWNVVISSRRIDVLKEIVKQVNEQNQSRYNSSQNIFDYIVCDVAQTQSFAEATQQYFTKFSKIDLVVFAPALYEQMTLKDFDCSLAKEIINVNLISIFDFFELVVKKMLDQKSGHIAVIASVAGYRGLPQSLAYGASKAGLINLCEGIYPELKAHNLNLSIINPGFVETRLTSKNKFAMPFIVSSQQASDYIYQGLESNKFEIHFPKKFTIIMKIIRILPYQIYLKIITNIYQKNISNK
jgi:short-subunit dehydrogenase